MIFRLLYVSWIFCSTIGFFGIMTLGCVHANRGEDLPLWLTACIAITFLPFMIGIGEWIVRGKSEFFERFMRTD